MRKLFLLGLFTLSLLLILYMSSFIAYFILYVLDIQTSMSLFLYLIMNVTSFIFFCILPIMTCISVALLIILSKRGKNKINYNPIQEPKIVVVLTAYNDEESIPVAVKDFKMQKNVIKVIVVDNNSSDRTYEYARISGAEVVKEENQGYGFACIRGLREALKTDANIIVLAEGDGTFVGYDINKLIPFLDNTDLVLGTRTTQELLDQQSQLDWFLVWGNLFLAKLIQIKYFDAKCWGKVRLTDVGCTMRAMRREALEKIIDQLKVGGMHFSPHMIMVALENNLKVVEVPITFRKRIGKSKGAGANRWKALKIGLRMLWHILTY